MLKTTCFNCKYLKSSIQEVSELNSENDILLQETWLFQFDLPLLNTISADHYAQGTSSVNCEESIVVGRPHGGLAMLWRMQ